MNPKSKRSSTSKASGSKPPPKPAFVFAALCLQSGGSGDLEPGELYRMIRDEAALSSGFLRVVDDSGEEYLYPQSYFAVVRVPEVAARSLLLVT